MILPWQTEIWEQLIARVRSGRLPHALLITGARGLGKTILARNFAQALLCEQPTATGMACTHCLACRRLLAKTHPDFLEVYPENQTAHENAEREDAMGADELSAGGTAKAKKGSRYIRIDQIRALGEWVVLKSHYNGLKVALIAPAEQMNIQAANSLLKTLEAPPGETLLMLASAHPGHLTATIRSRCQKLALPTGTADYAVPWLLAQGIDHQETAALLLTLAEGGPLTALELARSGALEQRLALFTDLEGIVMGRVAPVTIAQAWLNHEIERVMTVLWSWLTDMIRLSLVPAARLANPDLAPRLTTLAHQLGVRRLYVRLDHLTKIVHLIRGPTNPNLQLLLEDLLIPWRA